MRYEPAHVYCTHKYQIELAIDEGKGIGHMKE